MLARRRKMRHILLVGAASVQLSGCQGGCQTTPDAIQTEGKVDAALWASLDAASQTATALAQSGKLKGAQASSAKDLLSKYKAAVQAADSAYAAGDNATAQQNAVLAGQLLAQLTTIFAVSKEVK
jgi:hypothetical protein